MRPGLVSGGVRLPRAGFRIALVVGLALVVVPGSVGSWTPTPDAALDPALLTPVFARDTAVRTPSTAPDEALRSEGVLERGDVVLDPLARREAPSRVSVAAPTAPTRVILIPTWRIDPEISWYGPGFYGNRTACGQRYTETIMGVAHRSLPCGTLVSFKHGGREITVPVIDRGPYVRGRIFDLSRAACKALDHCYTGPIYYRIP